MVRRGASGETTTQAWVLAGLLAAMRRGTVFTKAARGNILTALIGHEYIRALRMIMRGTTVMWHLLRAVRGHSVPIRLLGYL